MPGESAAWKKACRKGDIHHVAQSLGERKKCLKMVDLSCDLTRVFQVKSYNKAAVKLVYWKAPDTQ